MADNNVYLHGSDDVLRGGRIMRDAADSMQSAASSMQSEGETMRRFLDQWLADFRTVLQEHAVNGDTSKGNPK